MSPPKTLDDVFRVLRFSPLLDDLKPAWRRMDEPSRQKAALGAKNAYLATTALQAGKAAALLREAFGADGPQAVACALAERLRSWGARQATGQGPSRARELACCDSLARACLDASAQARLLCLGAACACAPAPHAQALESLGFGCDAATLGDAVQKAFAQACSEMCCGFGVRGPAGDRDVLERFDVFGRAGGAKISAGLPPLRHALLANAPVEALQRLIDFGADPFRGTPGDPKPPIQAMLLAHPAYATALVQELELRLATPQAASKPTAGL